MAVAAVAALAGVGVSIYKGAHAANQEKKAKKERDNLKDPFFKVQDEYYQNQKLAADNAQSGLPTATKDFMTTESQRGLGTGIEGILSDGGSPNDITNLFDIYQRNIDKTGADDAEAHLKNIQYYMDANSTIGAEKQKQWSINDDQPYQRKLKEITQRRAAAQQNENNAINEGVGSLSALGTAFQNRDLLRALNKPAGGGTGSGFDANADYATWKENERLAGLPTNNVQPTTGKFSDKPNGGITEFIADYLRRNPADGLSDSNPVWNLSNRPI